ncbi:MAG: diaminopimelate epimerase [Actinomycetota bacterium]
MRFSKYHGAGNDFLLIEDLEDGIALTPALAAAMCDRFRGVGADGVIRVTRGRRAPFAMELWNADGGRAETSGNGMRCLARLLLDRGLTGDEVIEVDTPAGVKRIEVTMEDGEMTGARVDMGPPGLTRREIPMAGPEGERFVDRPFPDAGADYRAAAVSMGNPHLVLVGAEDLAALDLPRIGPALEHHPDFPARTNIEWVRVEDGRLDVRVWERGVGETLACGTGACASLVAASLMGLAGRRAVVRFEGGDLDVEWGEDDHVYLGGPAVHVYDGELSPAWLEALAEEARR